MKYKTTRRAIMNGFNTVIYCGYCDLQTLLTYENPAAYTVRREGWGADVYDLGGGVALVTGYAPFGSVRIPYDTCKEYEKKAAAIIAARGVDVRAELGKLAAALASEAVTK